MASVADAATRGRRTAEGPVTRVGDGALGALGARSLRGAGQLALTGISWATVGSSEAKIAIGTSWVIVCCV